MTIVEKLMLKMKEWIIKAIEVIIGRVLSMSSNTQMLILYITWRTWAILTLCDGGDERL